MNILDLSPLSLGPVDGPRQPGLSSYLNGKWVHGEEALQHCRVDPQSTFFDVWESLSLDPIQPDGNMRHRADLAVAQLAALNLDTQAEWCVAVPAHWSKSDLQLFLGVAQECQLSVQALFPRALGVVVGRRSEMKSCSVLEWGWNRLQRVNLQFRDGVLRLTGLDILSDGGVTSFFRRESKAMASLMLERHRVDPLYSGSTEQALFSSWWDWHRSLSPSWTYEIPGGAEILSEESPRLQELHDDWKATHELESADGMCCPPALAHLLGFAGVAPETFEVSPVLNGLNLSTGKGPRWRDKLILGSSPSSVTSQATHVVVDGVATPIPGNSEAQPGEQIQLPDGREGLAIRFATP